jgi:nucleotide-binding universal stress UspA family protein
MTSHLFPPRKILVPTDLSSTSSPAFDFAKVLHRQFGGSVHVLHAQHFDLPPYFSSGQLEDLRRELKRATRVGAEYLLIESTAALGFEPEVTMAAKPPVEAILEASSAADLDLIVMGTHGRHGADRFWLGSVAERILHESRKPVLSVRTGMEAIPFRHVLCPVNFTGVGQEALLYAAAIAEAGGIQLTVLHAVEEGNKPLDCQLVPDDVRARCRVEELTYHGDAAGSILTAAREIKPDVIVMGAERKPSIFGELFSSTTERIMQWGYAPLLVVPHSPAR